MNTDLLHRHFDALFDVIARARALRSPGPPLRPGGLRVALRGARASTSAFKPLLDLSATAEILYDLRQNVSQNTNLTAYLDIRHTTTNYVQLAGDSIF